MKHLGHRIQSWFRSSAPFVAVALAYLVGIDFAWAAKDPTDVTAVVTAAVNNERLTTKALSAAIAAYDAKNTGQSNQQQAAGEDQEAIRAQVATLAGLRCEIRRTPDQAWPWRTPDVKAIREAFLLPEDRPMAE